MKTAAPCYHHSSDDLGAGMSFPFPTQQRLMGNKIPFINDTSLSDTCGKGGRMCTYVCMRVRVCVSGFKWLHKPFPNLHEHKPPVLSALLSHVNLQFLSYLGRWVKAGRASSRTTHTLVPSPSISLSLSRRLSRLRGSGGGADKNQR